MEINSEGTRDFKGFYKDLIDFVMAVLSLLIIYWSIFPAIDIVFKRAIYVMLVFSLCAIIYPFYPSKKNKKVILIIDSFIILLIVISSIYVLINPYARFMRLSRLNFYDILFGVILIVISLDVGRRTIGWTLSSVAILIILYALFGKFIPGYFGSPGFDIGFIVSQVYAGLEGFYGMASNVMILYIVPFLIFASFLESLGASKFFMDLAFAATKNSTAGPAHAAVLGSALMGSLSGSAIVNVSTTGVFTIPLMKKVGYKPHMAAAIEAAASTGGQIMPPIMGTVAFLMAEFTQIPYLTIIAYAITPTIIYYISLFAYMSFRAKKLGIKVDKSIYDDLSIKDIFKKGWYYCFSLIAIIIIMLLGYPPNLAAMVAISVLIICDIATKKRINIKLYYKSIVLAGKDAMKIGSLVGCIGIVMAIVGLTGIGLKLSWLLSALSGGSPFLSILLTGVIGLILGMGLPSSAAYIILVVISAPAFINMGFPVITAHFITIWLSINAELTPPIGMASIVGAGIAKADPVKTMFTAAILGNALYILPFLFYYRPGILFQESILLSFEAILSTLLGLISCAAFCENHYIKKNTWFERILLLLSMFAFYSPNIVINFGGLIILFFVTLSQKRKINLSKIAIFQNKF